MEHVLQLQAGAGISGNTGACYFGEIVGLVCVFAVVQESADTFVVSLGDPNFTLVEWEGPRCQDGYPHVKPRLPSCPKRLQTEVFFASEHLHFLG